MFMARIAFLVPFVLVFAGCLGTIGHPDQKALHRGGAAELQHKLLFDPEWAEKAVPYGDTHNHKDATQHNFSTPNFNVLGWNPLISTRYGSSAGGYLCGDSADKGPRRLSVVHGLGTDVALIIVDVTDATKPQVVGELDMPTGGARDVAITPDGRYVVLGTVGPKQPEKGNPIPPVHRDNVATWRSACNDGPVAVPYVGDGPEEMVPFADGVVLVNIQDPKKPTIESYFPESALGVHSIYATQIGDNYYVLASIVNLVAAVSYFHLYTITTTPVGAKLVHVAFLNELPTEGNAPLINGHDDGVIAEHPITHKVYAYLAHWHQGLVIVDITNPRTPMIVGRWTDNPPGNTALASNDHGDIHEALPLDTLWNGKHYTFIGQEILGHPQDRPSGYIKALDTTDPAHPKDVATWSLPVDVQWSAALQFSTHYISRHNTTIFVSHYHAGVWAIDVSDIEHNPKLPSVGVFLPTYVSPKPAPGSRPYQWAPTVMENEALSNGDVVVWDSGTGCYVVHFDASQPAPARVWTKPAP
jgi:hypothetical protein